MGIFLVVEMWVKAVIFDLDDTLIHSGIDYKRVKNTIIKFLVDSGVTEGLLNESMSNLEIIERAVKDLRRKNIDESKIHNALSYVYEIFNEAEMEAIDKARLMDGAIETLSLLKSLGLKIGIVTNSCSAYARKIARRFSLDKYVDIIVARDETPRHKPDPEHLLWALRALSVRSSEAVFVGDHWVDALCAKGAGVKFILLRNRKWNIEDAERDATAVISSLNELPKTLQQI